MTFVVIARAPMELPDRALLLDEPDRPDSLSEPPPDLDELERFRLLEARLRPPAFLRAPPRDDVLRRREAAFLRPPPDDVLRRREAAFLRPPAEDVLRRPPAAPRREAAFLRPPPRLLVDRFRDDDRPEDLLPDVFLRPPDERELDELLLRAAFFLVAMWTSSFAGAVTTTAWMS